MFTNCKLGNAPSATHELSLVSFITRNCRPVSTTLNCRWTVAVENCRRHSTSAELINRSTWSGARSWWSWAREHRIAELNWTNWCFAVTDRRSAPNNNSREMYLQRRDCMGRRTCGGRNDVGVHFWHVLRTRFRNISISTARRNRPTMTYWSTGGCRHVSHPPCSSAWIHRLCYLPIGSNWRRPEHIGTGCDVLKSSLT